MIDDLLQEARRQAGSVTDLACRLVRLPSRGGMDDYEPVLSELEQWLIRRLLPTRRLYGDNGELLGLVCEVPGSRPGPWWVLDACVDTAPWGDGKSWSFPPTSGDVAEGWLRGRGAADSKTAAAVFCHIAACVAEVADQLTGGLAVLFDADEHTGGFGGARAYLKSIAPARPAGVMIGYPGLTEVIVGGRGVLRARVQVHGASGHSGSRRVSTGAVSRAARLISALEAVELPGGTEGFPLPPRLTVTEIHGGEGFTVLPQLCTVGVDIRLTEELNADAAEKLLHQVTTELDTTVPGPLPTTVDTLLNWPPYRLNAHEQPAKALLSAARHAGLDVAPKVAGPSNIGNLLAGYRVPATAGFGLPYEGLHGVDERVRLDELPRVHAVYHQAVLSLLGKRTC